MSGARARLGRLDCCQHVGPPGDILAHHGPRCLTVPETSWVQLGGGNTTLQTANETLWTQGNKVGGACHWRSLKQRERNLQGLLAVGNG